MDVPDVLSDFPRLSCLLLCALETGGSDLYEGLKDLIWTFLDPQVSHYVLDAAAGAREGKLWAGCLAGHAFVFPGETKHLWYRAQAGVFRIPSHDCAFELDETRDNNPSGDIDFFVIDAANGKWYMVSLDTDEVYVWRNETWEVVQSFREIRGFSAHVYDDEFVYLACDDEGGIGIWTWKLGDEGDTPRKAHTVHVEYRPLIWRGQVFDPVSGECLWPVEGRLVRKSLLPETAYDFWSTGRLGIEVARTNSPKQKGKISVCDVYRNLMFPVHSNLNPDVWWRYPFGLDKRDRLHLLQPDNIAVFVPVYQHGRALSRAQPIFTIRD